MSKKIITYDQAKILINNNRENGISDQKTLQEMQEEYLGPIALFIATTLTKKDLQKEEVRTWIKIIKIVSCIIILLIIGSAILLLANNNIEISIVIVIVKSIFIGFIIKNLMKLEEQPFSKISNIGMLVIPYGSYSVLTTNIAAFILIIIPVLILLYGRKKLFPYVTLTGPKKDEKGNYIFPN